MPLSSSSAPVRLILPIRKHQNRSHPGLIERKHSVEERAAPKESARRGDQLATMPRSPRDYEIRPVDRWLESSGRRRKCPKKPCRTGFDLPSRRLARNVSPSARDPRPRSPPVGIQDVEGSVCFDRRILWPSSLMNCVSAGNEAVHSTSLPRSPIRDNWGRVAPATSVTASRPSSQRKSEADAAVRSASVFPSSTQE